MSVCVRVCVCACVCMRSTGSGYLQEGGAYRRGGQNNVYLCREKRNTTKSLYEVAMIFGFSWARGGWRTFSAARGPGSLDHPVFKNLTFPGHSYLGKIISVLQTPQFQKIHKKSMFLID